MGAKRDLLEEMHAATLKAGLRWAGIVPRDPSPIAPRRMWTPVKLRRGRKGLSNGRLRTKNEINA
jgi:hypothetical protein